MKYTWIAVFVVAALLITMLLRALKKRKGAEVVFYMDHKQFDTCYELMDKKLFKALLSSFEYMSLRMNVAAAECDDEKMKLCLKKMDIASMNKQKREKLLTMAMMYFVDREDRKMCEEVLAELEKIKSGLAYLECKRMYHVFVLKDGEYIEEMEEEFQNTTDLEKKRELASYLVIQYENIGNRKKIYDYNKILKELMKEGKEV